MAHESDDQQVEAPFLDELHDGLDLVADQHMALRLDALLLGHLPRFLHGLAVYAVRGLLGFDHLAYGPGVVRHLLDTDRVEFGVETPGQLKGVF
jgi:hypothetical protein